MIRVWDLPVRLFHWLLVLCVIGSLVSVKFGGDAMTWHARLGYVALTLLGFRWVWGVIGPFHARFASFVKGPSVIRAYLRNPSAATLGHNPLGALSVLALLTFFTAQAVLGLFTTDEIAFDGPMVKHVGNEVVAWAGRLHSGLEPVLIGLVLLHVGSVVVHRWRYRHDLLRPMITGDQALPESVAGDSAAATASRDDGIIRTKAVIVTAFVAALVAYLSL